MPAYADEASSETEYLISLSFYSAELELIDKSIKPIGDVIEELTFTQKAVFCSVQLLNGVEAQNASISINGKPYGSEKYYDILALDDCLVEVSIFDQENEVTGSYSITLVRRKEARSNEIESLQWHVIGQDGRMMFAEDIALDSEVKTVEVPYSSEYVSVDYLIVESQFVDVKIILEDGIIADGNEGPVELYIDENGREITVESSIDGETSTYNLSFVKAREASDDNTLQYIEQDFFDEDFNILHTVNLEGDLDQGVFDVFVPDRSFATHVFAQSNNIAAMRTYYIDGELTDEQSFEIADVETIDIEVMAENGDKKTYTINLKKDADKIEPVGESADNEMIEDSNDATNEEESAGFWQKVSQFFKSIFALFKSIFT